MRSAFVPSTKIEEYFALLASIPHGSGNEARLSDAIVKIAQDAGLEVYQDEVKNVLIKRPASKGSEDKAPVMIQAHIDMVCAKKAGSDHDFLNDPLSLYVDEKGWLHADGTTLGADDGYGVAYILGFLTEPSLKNPPLECLLTVDEEVGMKGAKVFDYSKITARQVISLDSFGVSENCVGSCMGRRMDFTIPMKKAEAQGEGYTVSVTGLLGGHSAVDVTTGHANANKLLAYTVTKLSAVGAVLVSAKGGEADNAIPRFAEANVLIPAGKEEEAKKIVADLDTRFKNIYEFTDPGVNISIEKAEFEAKEAYCPCAMEFVTALQNGVREMDHVHTGAVACSDNLGVLKAGDGILKIGGMLRSNRPEWMMTLTDEMLTTAKAFGAAAEIVNDSPGMQYRPQSRLREMYLDIVERMLGVRPVEVTTHGGLEIGYFATNLNDPDIVTAGVEAVGAHSPDEAMDLKSFNDVYAALTALIEELA